MNQAQIIRELNYRTGLVGSQLSNITDLLRLLEQGQGPQDPPQPPQDPPQDPPAPDPVFPPPEPPEPPQTYRWDPDGGDPFTSNEYESLGDGVYSHPIMRDVKRVERRRNIDPSTRIDVGVSQAGVRAVFKDKVNGPHLLVLTDQSSRAIAVLFAEEGTPALEQRRYAADWRLPWDTPPPADTPDIPAPPLSSGEWPLCGVWGEPVGASGDRRRPWIYAAHRSNDPEVRRNAEAGGISLVQAHTNYNPWKGVPSDALLDRFVQEVKASGASGVVLDIERNWATEERQIARFSEKVRTAGLLFCSAPKLFLDHFRDVQGYSHEQSTRILERHTDGMLPWFYGFDTAAEYIGQINKLRRHGYTKPIAVIGDSGFRPGYGGVTSSEAEKTARDLIRAGYPFVLFQPNKGGNRILALFENVK